MYTRVTNRSSFLCWSTRQNLKYHCIEVQFTLTRCSLSAAPLELLVWQMCPPHTSNTSRSVHTHTGCMQEVCLPCSPWGTLRCQGGVWQLGCWICCREDRVMGGWGWMEGKGMVTGGGEGDGERGRWRLRIWGWEGDWEIERDTCSKTGGHKRGDWVHVRAGSVCGGSVCMCTVVEPLCLYTFGTWQ